MSTTIANTIRWTSGAALAGASGTAVTGVTAYENSASSAFAHGPCFADGGSSRKATGSSIQSLIQGLGSENDATQQIFEHQLLAQSGSIVRPLVDALRRSSNERIRKGAAMTLGRIAREQAISSRRIGTIAKTLLAAAQQDPSEGVVAAASLEVGLLGDQDLLSPKHREAALRTLSVIALHARSDIVRLKAAKALHFIGGEDARADIHDEVLTVAIRTLDDDDRFTRSYAANILLELQDERSVPALIEAAKDAGDLCYRPAILALCKIGDTQAAPTLVKALGSDNVCLSPVVWKALSKMKTDAMDALVEGLLHENPNVRQLCAALLGDSGANCALAALLQMLGSTHSADKRSALHAIANLGDKRALPPLRSFFETTTEEEDRKTVAETIARLGADVKRMSDESVRAIEHTARDIALALKAKLGLQSSIDVFLSRIGTLGLMSSAGGSWHRAALMHALGFTHRSHLLPPDALVSVDLGEDEETTRAMMKTLNHLVHHEMAHLFQIEREIPKPRVDTQRFEHIDPKTVKEIANEVLMDRFALDMARTFYVAGGGDALFDEDQREAIAIGSALSIFRMVETRLETEENPESIEASAVARDVAVMLSIAESKVINKKTSEELRHLADRIERLSWGDRGKAFIIELHELIKTYEAVFENNTLQHWL